MFTEERLFEVLDSAVKDISYKVIKIDVINTPDTTGMVSLNPCNVYTRTRGDYDLTFVLCTDFDVLKKMTCNMKHGAEANEEDVPLYMQEFLNILCGRFVSNINQSEKLKVFFEVPCFVKGEYQETPDEAARFRGKYFYDSPYGSLELKIFCS